MASSCEFCGEIGHCASFCLSANKYKPDKPDITVNTSMRRVTRSRTKTISNVTLGDILYDNHICVKPSYKRVIDAFVAEQFTKRGMVDDISLAEHVFDVPMNMHDEGHMTVIGYIVAKYCDASNADVKRFLRDYRAIFADFATYQVMVKTLFGVIPIVKNGSLHYRKFTGDICKM